MLSFTRGCNFHSYFSSIETETIDQVLCFYPNVFILTGAELRTPSASLFLLDPYSGSLFALLINNNDDGVIVFPSDKKKEVSEAERMFENVFTNIHLSPVINEH